MSIAFRKAIPSDAEAVWQLRRDSILHACAGHYEAKLLERWTSGSAPPGLVKFLEAEFYLALEEEELVATGMINLETGKLDFIFVLPSRMGCGIGSQVLQQLEEAARAAGLRELHLDATLNAAGFYRKHGYEGDKVELYHSPRGFSLPCYPMTRVLRD